MIDDAHIAAIRSGYPCLSHPSIDWQTVVLNQDIRLLEVDSGTRLFEAGNPCIGFPLVLEGEIRVTHQSSLGRSLELYRVVPGEICIVSCAGLLSHRPLIADGIALQRSRLALLSVPLFNLWSEHPPFRQFVFGMFADRLRDLMAVVDAVAFQRLDCRLADYLLGHGRVVHATHQGIAEELGTVREMVTRLLNRFESGGAVALARERIEILDAVLLRAIASGESPSRQRLLRREAVPPIRL